MTNANDKANPPTELIAFRERHEKWIKECGVEYEQWLDGGSHGR